MYGISGFLEQTGSGAHHAIDNSFVGQRMDADEAISVREGEEHCPLCLSIVRPDERDITNRRHICTGLSVMEDEVVADRHDFREDLDAEKTYDRCEVDGDEVVVRGCTAEFLWQIQEMGCTGVVSLGRGLYDAFFPKEYVSILVVAM